MKMFVFRIAGLSCILILCFALNDESVTSTTCDILEKRLLHKLNKEMNIYKTALEKTESKLQETWRELAEVKSKFSTGYNDVLRDRRLTFDKPANHSVAFSAQMGEPNENLGTHQIVIYHTVLTNIRGAYNKDTGMFRCPVSGLYLFSVTTMTFYADNVVTELVVNGHAVLSLFAGSGSRHNQATNTVLYSLDVGDLVWVRIAENSIWNSPAEHVYGYSWSTFNGVLINVI